MKNPFATILHSCIGEYNSFMREPKFADVQILDKLLTAQQRQDSWVSNVCSSREGQAISNSMAIAGLSLTAARSRVRLNAKGSDASPDFEAAFRLVDFVNAYRRLTGQVDVYAKLYGGTDSLKDSLKVTV